MMKTVVDNFTSRWNPISPVGFFEKNNQGKQDTFTTAIALFSKETGISGRTGDVVKMVLEKSGLYINNIIIIS